MIKIEVVPRKTRSRKQNRGKSLHYAEFILRFPINCTSEDEKDIRKTLERMCQHIFKCTNPEELENCGITTYFSATKYRLNRLPKEDFEIIDTNGSWINKSEIRK